MSRTCQTRARQAANMLVQTNTRPSGIGYAPFLYQTKTILRCYSELDDILGSAEASSPGRRPLSDLRLPDSRHVRTRRPTNDARGDSGMPKHSRRPLDRHRVPSDMADRLFGSEKAETAMKVEAKPVQRAMSSGGFVPFEGAEDVFYATPSDMSTMTAKEREAFRRLEKVAPTTRVSEPLASPQQRLQQKQRHDRRPLSGLDAILDEANAERDKPAVILRRQSLRNATAQDHQVSVVAGSDNLSEITGKVLTIPIKQRRRERSGQIRQKLEDAQSDVELWEVFEGDMLAPVAALKLDEARVVPQAGTQQPESDEARNTAEDGTPLNVIGPTFHSSLTRMARLLYDRFPTSPLLHAIIPRVRQVGPSAFALGVTTNLYNLCLAHRVDRDMDIPAAIDLLSEMEREVIEPDEATLNILIRCMTRAREIRHGADGEAAKVNWTTDRMKKSLREINSWVDRVRRTVDMHHTKP